MLTRRNVLATGAKLVVVASQLGVRRARALALSSGDDTAALQAMLDQGGTVTLERGRTYRLSRQPGQEARAALVMGPDTTLDLSGATLELAPDQRCSLIGLRRNRKLGNISVINGRIVGNGKLQSASYGDNFTPTIDFRGCDKLEFNNLQIHDSYLHAIYAKGNGGTVKDISVSGATGGGIWLAGDTWEIDGISVRDVTYLDNVNCQGNPFIVSLRNSRIGAIKCENYGYGVKFQDGCRDLTIRSITALAGPNNNEFLVKIQGKLPDTKRNSTEIDRPNLNISIDQIVARRGPYCGLYIFHSMNVQIASYQGIGNGRKPGPTYKYGADTLIIDSDKVAFGKFHAEGFLDYALWLHDRTGRVEAAEFVVDRDAPKIPSTIVVRSGIARLHDREYRP